MPNRLTTGDYRVATAGLGGVASFLSAHSRVFHEGADAPVASTVAVETDAEPVVVRVYVPPEGPYRSDR